MSQPGTAETRRWWALGALALAMLTVGLDGTVLNVAVPTMATALQASTDQLQWFSTAYTLTLAAALMPLGMLGDRYGRKKFLLEALMLFGVASLWCAEAAGPGSLIAARALLGLAAAALMPMSMAVLPVLFPKPADRAKAITIWVTSTAVGLPLGPILGGYLLNHFWWGSVFLINIPLVAVALVAVTWLVPESKSALPRRLDVPGVILSSVGLLGLTYGVIAAGRDGWGSSAALWPLVVGLIALGALAVVERRRPDPLIGGTLLADRDFRIGITLAVLVSFALMGLLFAMPLFFQEVGGHSASGDRCSAASPDRRHVGGHASRAEDRSARRCAACAGRRSGDPGHRAVVRRVDHRAHAVRIVGHLDHGYGNWSGPGHADVDDDGHGLAHRRAGRRGIGVDASAAPGRRHHRGRVVGERAVRFVHRASFAGATDRSARGRH